MKVHGRNVKVIWILSKQQGDILKDTIKRYSDKLNGLEYNKMNDEIYDVVCPLLQDFLGDCYERNDPVYVMHDNATYVFTSQYDDKLKEKLPHFSPNSYSALLNLGSANANTFFNAFLIDILELDEE